MFAAKKRIENQRKELVTLLQYAYGNEGLEEYRRCMKEVQAQRQQEVYAQQEAKDTAVKSFWIVVLVGLAGWLIAYILNAVVKQRVRMDQGMINTIITLGAGIFGWIMKTLWDSVRKLEKMSVV